MFPAGRQTGTWHCQHVNRASAEWEPISQARQPYGPSITPHSSATRKLCGAECGWTLVESNSYLEVTTTFKHYGMMTGVSSLDRRERGMQGQSGVQLGPPNSPIQANRTCRCTSSLIA